MCFEPANARLRPTTPVDAFDPGVAFSRNVGWVTDAERVRLAGARIAIAGLGGVGGSHLLTLTRLGVGAFHVSDFDVFELANFNRQAGAAMSTLGRSKTEVLAGMARDINPQLDVRRFDAGVNAENADAFLRGCDLYVDGLDFFAIEARRLLFAACARLGVPAVTAAPIGMGVAVLVFLPGRGLTFEQYFQLEGHSEHEQLIRLMVGLSPSMLQAAYVADPSRVDFARHVVPSTPMACELCAGMAATEALKILLKRGRVRPAPHGLHFDAYRGKLRRTWRPGGNRNPIQKLILAFARRRLEQFRYDNPAEQTPGRAAA